MVLVQGEGGSFLGEDLVGWRTALIAAVLAALAYEAFVALLRRLKPGGQFMALRLPFVVLLIARVTVSSTAWAELHGPLKADLWDVLEDDERGFLRRFWAGMAFSLSLVFGGACRTARALELPAAFTARKRAATPRAVRKPPTISRRTRRLAIGMAIVTALAGMNGPTLLRLLDQQTGGDLSTKMLVSILILVVVGEVLLVCGGLLVVARFRKR
jgi:hypothetical protein